MATKVRNDLPSSPQSYYSDDEDVEPDSQEEDQRQPVNNNVANILARLQSSGALIKKPKKEHYCFTCKLDFPDWEQLENHLIQHVSLPSVVVDKLPSDDEDFPPSGDENWSDEEEEKVPQQKTPQKIDVSQILKNKGLSIKKKEIPNTTALDKLNSLGLTIKNNKTPIKKEKPDTSSVGSTDVMQKLGKLGGIKLKLKSDGNNTNTFKVINGLRDFKASDDEDDSDKDEQEQDEDNVHEKSEENDESKESEEEPSTRKPSESDDSDSGKLSKLPSGIKLTPVKKQQEEPKPSANVNSQPRPRGRPAVKKTPTRANLQASRASPNIRLQKEPEMASSPDRPASNASAETVIIKKELPDPEPESSTPLLSGQIKSERMSPPLPDSSSAPLVTKIKTEKDAPTPTTVSTTTTTTIPTAPLVPIKTEEPIAVIEINGDSNDEDDDCCVVSTTPAPDIKPKIENTPVAPKIEEVMYPAPSSTSAPYSSSNSYALPNYSSASSMPSRMQMQSTEKQHHFNWNAPDSKPLDMLEKSADDILESLLSSGKKENMLSDASEYISLDKLGSQHTCDVCNTRFTEMSLLDEHRRITGHSQSLVLPSAAPSSLLPYAPSTDILSSLLPVKQLADQVGKLSSIGSGGPGYTHQQNVMINIQAYPGSGGVMMPGQTPYNSYQSNPNMHSNYPPTSNMYGPNSQQMPGPYQSGNYMGSNMPYGQYPQQIPKSTYPGTMPQNSYGSQSPYSVSSPMQNMQQSIYGQSGMMNQQGSMGPPGSSPSHQQQYTPVSSPSGMMKPPNNSGIKIQNVQTFPPGHLPGPGMAGSSQDMNRMPAPGQSVSGQMPPPSMRVTSGPPRPRMPSMRAQRPSSVRGGMQIGQVRGGRPGQRMPLKRAAGGMVGQPIKRRPDMLLPGKHDNEDCQVMAMQKQREGLPLIQSVQGAKDKLGSQISITKKTVNKEASAMANVLASRGISIKQKQKSRSPTPERPLPHIPNLGKGVSIKHTSKSSSFSIPEAKVGGGMLSCKICKKIFGSHSSLQAHMINAHPESKIPLFKCDECPASYPKSLQLQHHKRVFHNVHGPNKELGLPVVDLSQMENLKKLSNLGIYSFIPLATREQSNGSFGIPVISVHNMQSGLTSSLQAIGADGLLSLGPLKPLPNT